MSTGRFSNLEMPGASAPQPGPPPAGRAAPGPRAATGTARCFVPELKDADAFLREAMAGELAGDLEGALRRYSAALDDNPLLLEAWVGQLWILIRLDEFPEARLWADKALEHFPESADLLAAKSLALFRMGHESDGRALNDTALEKRGESALVWLARGEIMLRSSRKAAEECFARALRCADQTTDVTLLRIVAVALRNGKYSLALTLTRQAIAAHPATAHAWYLQGVAQEELGLAAEAQHSYQEAADLAPGNSSYKAALGRQAPGFGARLARLWRRLVGSG